MIKFACGMGVVGSFIGVIATAGTPAMLWAISSLLWSGACLVGELAD